MKIAIFTDTFLPQINGVTNTLRRLGDYLKNEGIEYIFITPDQKTEEVLPYNMEQFFSAPLIFYPECRFTITNKSKLYKKLDAFNPDIIFLMTEFNMGLAGLSYGKKHGIPIVSNYSTNFGSLLKAYKLGVLEKVSNKYLGWFHNEADYTVTPSEESQKELYKMGVHDVGIFGRGIDYHRFSPTKYSETLLESLDAQEKVNLLYVGRLSPEKGLSILRETMFKLNETYKDKINLIITGEGPMEQELHKTMPGNVIFTGYKKGSELEAIYASADIFAFPSTFETFGNVVLEAMASGTPVVGVSEGGVKTLVDHGKTGFLAEPRDSDSFTKHIETLINNCLLRQQFSHNGRQFAESKSWEAIFGDLIQLFHEVAKKTYHIEVSQEIA